MGLGLGSCRVTAVSMYSATKSWPCCLAMMAGVYHTLSSLHTRCVGAAPLSTRRRARGRLP